MASKNTYSVISQDELMKMKMRANLVDTCTF